MKKTLLTGMAASLLTASSAMAVGVPVSSFSLNFEGAADALGATYTNNPAVFGNLENINDINQMSYFGHSVVSFDSNPFIPTPSGKVGFDDYIVLRFDQFQQGATNRLNDFTGYGKSAGFPGSPHQLTFVTHVRGTFNQATGQIEMSSGSVQSANFVFDVTGTGSAANGNVANTYSQADFTDVTTLNNGLVVEVGTDPLSGTGVLHTQGGAAVATNLIFNMQLEDVLGTLPGGHGPFEFIAGGVGPNEFVFGSGGDENDLDILDPDTDVDFAGFNSVFGSSTYYNGPTDAANILKNGAALVGPIGTYMYQDSVTGRFTMVAQNKGKFTKSIVPEPATAALAFLGLAGLARATGRRK